MLEKLVEHLDDGDGASKLYSVVDPPRFSRKVKTVYARYAADKLILE